MCILPVSGVDGDYVLGYLKNYWLKILISNKKKEARRERLKLVAWGGFGFCTLLPYKKNRRGLVLPNG